MCVFCFVVRTMEIKIVTKTLLYADLFLFFFHTNLLTIFNTANGSISLLEQFYSVRVLIIFTGHAAFMSFQLWLSGLTLDLNAVTSVVSSLL